MSLLCCLDSNFDKLSLRLRMRTMHKATRCDATLRWRQGTQGARSRFVLFASRAFAHGRGVWLRPARSSHTRQGTSKSEAPAFMCLSFTLRCAGCCFRCGTSQSPPRTASLSIKSNPTKRHTTEFIKARRCHSQCRPRPGARAELFLKLLQRERRASSGPLFNQIPGL